jgi:hypothetical protein
MDAAWQYIGVVPNECPAVDRAVKENQG